MKEPMPDVIYVAGPMTNHPQFNIPAFDAAALDLRGRGFNVISPAELDDPEIRAISMASPDGAIATLQSHGQTWGDFLARDVKLITDGGITTIFVLPGWRKSRGARLETFVAAAMNGMRVYCYECFVASDGNLTKSRVSPYALETAWAGREHDGPGGHG